VCDRDFRFWMMRHPPERELQELVEAFALVRSLRLGERFVPRLKLRLVSSDHRSRFEQAVRVVDIEVEVVKFDRVAAVPGVSRLSSSARESCRAPEPLLSTPRLPQRASTGAGTDQGHSAEARTTSSRGPATRGGDDRPAAGRGRTIGSPHSPCERAPKPRRLGGPGIATSSSATAAEPRLLARGQPQSPRAVRPTAGVSRRRDVECSSTAAACPPRCRSQVAGFRSRS